MNLLEAKSALDKIIDKARVHLYKPIQVAEILYRYRVNKDIELNDLTTYRTQSRKWRDYICIQFLGRTSTSSARYQDDVFNDNAVPPSAIVVLGKENNAKKGIVEKYIYSKFKSRFCQLSSGLEYCNNHDKNNFKLEEFISKFWEVPGLRRSIDKVYEIIVYSLFSTIVEVIELKIDIYINKSTADILNQFPGFSEKVIGIDDNKNKISIDGQINRVGITNAADRGLDMWSNFGLAIQVKHLSLTEELAESIVDSVSADRIVIICKDTEERIILSLLNQIGWKSRIQSIVTESELIKWYEVGLRGRYSDLTGEKILAYLKNEIHTEFPSTNNIEFERFMKERNYHELNDDFWE